MSQDSAYYAWQSPKQRRMTETEQRFVYEVGTLPLCFIPLTLKVK